MILGKYNQAKTVTFDLVAPDGVDLIINATFAGGDVVIMKDEGAEANTTNLPTDEGTGYSLVLTATEMSAARIRVYIIDQTATKIWLDISLGLESYGNASAEHEFDLDNPTVNSFVQGYLTTGLIETATGRIAKNIEFFYDNLNAQTDKKVDDVGGGSAGGGFINADYRWSTNTAATDPGSGRIKFNNTDYTLVTAIYISEVTDNNFNALGYLNALSVDDEIIVAQSSDGTRYGDFTVSGALTDNTGWQTIPVTYVDSGTTNIGNNQTARVQLYYIPEVMRGTDGAALAVVCTETRLAELDAANLPADTNDIQTRLPSALVSGLMSSDVTAISTDTVAADNLELQYNLTGLTGDTFPSNQQQVGNLSTGSAAISVSADSRVLTVGTEVNTITDTESLDGVYHEITDAAGAMDIYYEFDIGGSGIGVDVTTFGRLNSANDDLAVQAYDWDLAVWNGIGTLNGVNGSTDQKETDNLLLKHTGAGANLGKVRVRFFAASGLSGSTLFIDQLFISFSVVNNSVGYSNGKVWVDTNNGSAGSVSFVNGTADNPSLTLTDATTIAGNVGLSSFNVAPGSTVTLIASYSSAVATIYGATLNLNSQDISNTNTFGGTIAGITTGAGPVFFTDAEIQVVTFPPSHFDNCSFSGMFTVGSAGSFILTKCYSELITTNFIINFAALGATEFNLRSWSGTVEVQNMATGDTIEIEGHGAIVINANCSAGTLKYRGDFTFTDNSGSVTVTNDDNTLSLDQLITQIDTAASEPGQGGPPVSAKMALKIDYLYKWSRNRSTSTATNINMFADDATTVDHKMTHDDDGTTYDQSEIITGP